MERKVTIQTWLGKHPLPIRKIICKYPVIFSVEAVSAEC
jgi:hypothetical protein